MHTTQSHATLKPVLWIALATAVLLLVPLVAMQFTDQVDWTPTDFAVASALLFGSGLAYLLIARSSRGIAGRLAACIAVGAALLLVWSNLAVGLIGSENNPANLMYIGVIAVEIIGIAMARMRPRGMARALLATALAQAVVAVIALAAGLGVPPNTRLQILILNGFFFALFASAAWLFRHAASRDSERASE